MTMLISKVAYTINHPRIMWHAGLYRLNSLFGQSDYRKFIVLTQGRSGSNLLISMLNSHPEIHAKGEIFHRLHGRPPERVLDKIFALHPAHVRAVGFKIFYYHPLDEPTTRVWELLAGIDGLHVVHLKRQNLLRLVLSRKIAERTDSWVIRSDKAAANTAPKRPIDLSADELRASFTEIRETQARCAAIFREKPMLTCGYEDVVRNPGSEFGRITDFLGLDAFEPEASVRQQNPERLSSLIGNYSELRAAFAGSEWETFFDDRQA